MRLGDIAFARSGDKGDILDITVVARTPEGYDMLRRSATPQSVSDHLKEFVRGEVTRYELPQLAALKFVLRNALDGGVTRSLALDKHGKTLSAVLLDMQLDPEEAFDQDMKDTLLDVLPDGYITERPPEGRRLETISMLIKLDLIIDRGCDFDGLWTAGLTEKGGQVAEQLNNRKIERDKQKSGPR
jgi:hypothetical protein